MAEICILHNFRTYINVSSKCKCKNIGVSDTKLPILCTDRQTDKPDERWTEKLIPV